MVSLDVELESMDTKIVQVNARVNARSESDGVSMSHTCTLGGH